MWPIREKEQIEAERFYLAVGRVVARWALLEFQCGALFHRATEMPVSQAKHVFHSASSWRGKTSMLRAAIEERPGPPGLKTARLSILAKAERYYSVRNAVAHDMYFLMPIWVARGGTRRELAIRPHQSSLEPIYDEKALERCHLENASQNIHLLSAITSLAIMTDPNDQLGCPERLQYLLALLPDDARSTAPEATAVAIIETGIEKLAYPL